MDTTSESCSQCGMALVGDQDRERTEDAVFCRSCYTQLTQELEQTIASQGENINYPMAVVGGLIGGVLGAVAWWGFTVLTNIAFGLVAVVIGFAVGKGVVLLSGGKRHLNLQIVSLVITITSYAYASYLVNRSFIQQAFAEEGSEMLLPLIPDPTLFVEVVKAGAGIMDLVFLAIALIQAWQIPAPLSLAKEE